MAYTRSILHADPGRVVTAEATRERLQMLGEIVETEQAAENPDRLADVLGLELVKK